MDAPRELEAVPGVLGIHHVALAVVDIDLASAPWRALGGHVEIRAVVESQGVEAMTLEWPPGGSLLELIAPHGESSGVARFLDSRGPGLHHVAFAVVDIAAAMASLSGSGVQLIDEQPRPGLHGTPVAFVRPRSMGGVLVELVEVPEP